MEELRAIELDLLFRIDFFALTNFGEEGYTDDRKFEEEKKKLKDAFGFSQYFQREFQGYEYVRLSHLQKDIRPYIEYLRLLENQNLFDCCQLEQAIGVFQKGVLKAFLSTDSGLCYNSSAHFDSVEEIFRTGESNLGGINTFHGKISGDSIVLLYSPKSNNIDIDKLEEINSITINKIDFESELRKLKRNTNQFFTEIKQNLKSEMIKQEEKDFIDAVFKDIKD